MELQRFVVLVASVTRRYLTPFKLPEITDPFKSCVPFVCERKIVSDLAALGEGLCFRQT